MSRATATILDQVERFLPRRYLSVEPVLAGGAAMFAEAERVWAELVDASTIEGASGRFLRLRARGFGVGAQPDETDASIRSRIRTIEGQVTRKAILDAVDALLAPYTSERAGMLERRDEGALDVDCVIGRTRVGGAHNSFVLVVPLVGDAWGGLSVVGRAVIGGDAVVGMAGEMHPVYAAIRALVLRLRAAGIRVYMAVEV